MIPARTSRPMRASATSTRMSRSRRSVPHGLAATTIGRAPTARKPGSCTSRLCRTARRLRSTGKSTARREAGMAASVPLWRCLDARHQAPLLVPALCAVAKGLEAAQLVFARERALHGDRVGRLARQSMKSIVAGEAKDVVDALGFLAPLHRLGAAVMAVAAHQDVDLGPMPADAFDDMLEDRADLLAGRRLALAQDHRHRLAACRPVDVDPQKAALGVNGVHNR